MQLVTIADIVGDSAAHALGAGSVRAIFLTPIGGTARLGDGSVGAARGVQLQQSVMQAFYADPDDMTARFDLTLVKAYVPTGTTLTITYEA